MNTIKCLLLGALALLLFEKAGAQKINYFDPAIEEYGEGKYEEAIRLYEEYLAENENFLPQHKAVYHYKIGYCYVSLGDLKKGWDYLNMAVDSGYNDVDIIFDVRYEALHKDIHWDDFEHKIEAAFVINNFHIPNIKLAWKLTTMHAKDILYRNSFGTIKKKYGKDSPEMDSVRALQDEYDKKNQAELREILENSGWPSKGMVGKEATGYAFDVLRHSDIEVQKEFRPEIKKAYENESITAFDYAVIEDQISLAENGKQIYGTQVIQKENGDIIIEPIIEERNLDARRNKIGLESMADYMIVYGYVYTLPKY